MDTLKDQNELESLWLKIRQNGKYGRFKNF